MKVRHHDIEIPKDNPFEHCKLNRRPYAEVLADIVSTYAEGFVLAVNNPWGTGKTTFMKMWEQHLKNQDFKTLYFNAWENDFEPDVLVALISELEELSSEKTKESFGEIVKKAGGLATQVGQAFLKKFVERQIGDEALEDIANGMIDEGAKGLRAHIDSYKKRKEGLEGFREKLYEFVEKASPDKPVVFIIDELDRCRPSYAVEVLEEIKHVFSVRGIVFVLSIDKEQLGHAVRGAYGSDQIDADEYLKRFIDLEYQMPKPSIPQFVKYLFAYYGYSDFLGSQMRQSNQALYHEGQTLLQLASDLFEINELTLRQIEKIMCHLRLVLESHGEYDNLYPGPILFLIFWKHLDEENYKLISTSSISLKDLNSKIEQLIFKRREVPRRDYYLQAQSQILAFYSHFRKTKFSDSELFEDDNDGNKTLSISTKFDYLLLQESVINTLNFHYSISLGQIIDKIDMLEPID